MCGTFQLEAVSRQLNDERETAQVHVEVIHWLQNDISIPFVTDQRGFHHSHVLFY